VKKILLNNEEIKETLYGFSNWFFAQDLSVFEDKNNWDVYKEPYREALSLDYLNQLIEKGDKHEGYPESLGGVEITEPALRKEFMKEFSDPIKDVLFKMTSLLAAQCNVLCAYYPADGYIGWHNNWNASGHNMVFTFSETGDGYFMYRDPVTHEIVKMQDEEKTWTCKAGYYGSPEETDKHFWHAADSNGGRRLTFAYLIPNELMWNMAIEDVETP
jgi:hypothetical protein